jgi:hypothetical protein
MMLVKSENFMTLDDVIFVKLIDAVDMRRKTDNFYPQTATHIERLVTIDLTKVICACARVRFSCYNVVAPGPI